MDVSRPHEPFLDLCAGYVMQILDPHELAELEAHLAEGCAECEGLIEEISEGGALLATSAPLHPAPPSVKERVLAGIHSAGAPPESTRSVDRPSSADPDRRGRAASSPTARPERRKAPGAPASAGAVIYRIPAWARVTMAGLAAACTLLVFDGLRVRNQNEQLDQQLVIVRAQLSQIEEQLGEQQKWAQVLSSTESRFALLEATPDGHPDQTAWAVVHPGSDRAVVLLSDATAPAGHDYELWAIADGAPRSLGLLEADATGRAMLRLEGIGEVEALAVSLEPEGGSPNPRAPSGPVVLVGAVRG
jgi:hypothetical protein